MLPLGINKSMALAIGLYLIFRILYHLPANREIYQDEVVKKAKLAAISRSR